MNAASATLSAHLAAKGAAELSAAAKLATAAKQGFKKV